MKMRMCFVLLMLCMACSGYAQDFGVSITPPAQSVAAGNAATYTVTVTTVAGQAGSIALTIAGSSGTSVQSANATLTTTVATPAPPGTLTVTSMNGSEFGSAGQVVSASALNSSEQGSSCNWSTESTAWSNTSTSQITIQGGNLGSFPNLVTAGTDSSDGSGTRHIDYNHAVDGQLMRCHPPSTISKMSIGLFLTPGPKGPWGMYDYVTFNGKNGQDCVLQYNWTGSAGLIQVESWTPSHGTKTGVIIPVTAGNTYWVSGGYNATNNTCSVAVLDPVSMVQIGNTSIQWLDNSPVGNVAIGGYGHGVTSNYHTGLDDMLFDWNAGVFPLVP